MADETPDQMLDVDSTGERRTDSRTATTVFRPVLIETREFAGFCLTRNLSSNGMMGKVYTQFAEGIAVAVQFNPDLTVSGWIVWAEEGHVGIQFDEDIDVSKVLSSLGSGTLSGGRLNRAPRLPIEAEGEVLVEDRPVSILVQDISQRGLKVRASHLRQGDEVVVCVAGLDQRKAVVRWTRPGTAGLNFIRPLGFDQLAEWVIHQQAGDASFADDDQAGMDATGYRRVG